MAFARATATIQSPIRCAGAGKKTVKVNSRSLWRPVQVAGADSLMALNVFQVVLQLAGNNSVSRRPSDLQQQIRN
jgi:hypothetical protein